MKKLIALFVSTLLFATSLTSLAAGAPASAQDTATQEALTKAEQYAYLDLDSASPSMQQKTWMLEIPLFLARIGLQMDTKQTLKMSLQTKF